jgi:membrane-anchored protein YejM (alkaline phosphatase superfamily)
MIDSWNFTTCDSIISPNIYKFAHEGQMFTDHNSSNYGTRGGIFGLFFGLSFTYENEFQISKMSPLFIDRMLELGYNVETFPSATLISPPFYEIIFRRVPGITVNTKGATPFDRDAAITWNFLNYLDSRDPDKPFFSFVFYDLPHAMTLPEKYQKKFPSTWNAPDYLALNNKTDPEPFFNLYKSCVYRTDQLIGDILAKLKKKRMLENTIIIISGDHGQEFNENKKNYWGHGSNYTKWQIRIPFIIYYPGIEAGKVNSHMTTHYDVAPTLLHRFLGVENPLEDYSMGHDLWDTCSRYPHVVGDHINYAFITPRLILKTGHIGSIDITDHNLNVLPRDSINIKELREAIELKNRFYK